MNKKWLLVIVLPILLKCSFDLPQGWKELDLSAFKISIPDKWIYVKEHGEDSFVGIIKTNKSELSFDCSSMGYAARPDVPELEYLRSEDWVERCYFCKPGITYTDDRDLKKEKAAQMKKLNTSDSTLVHVEIDPSYQVKTKIFSPTKKQKIKFPKADYIAQMTYKDSTIYVPIEIPVALKTYFIKLDTTDKYIIKTYWPKNAGKGLTGIYMHSRSSSFSFQMTGENLSVQEQESALKAFKTITFKK